MRPMISPGNDKLTLLILAAGVGRRFGGLKQLEGLGPCAETLMDYSIYDSWRAGFSRVVFVIREETKELFENHFGRGVKNQIEIDYVFQQLPEDRKKPWGTAHAILTAAKILDGPFVSINADDYYGAESFRNVADFLNGENTTSHCILCFPLERTLSDHGGVARAFCDFSSDKTLLRIDEAQRIEKTSTGAKFKDSKGVLHHYTGKELISMNMWGLRPAVFDHLRVAFEKFLATNHADEDAEFFIPSAMNQLIQTNVATVKIVQTPSRWMGITYREDTKIVESTLKQLVKDGTYPSPLWQEN